MLQVHKDILAAYNKFKSIKGASKSTGFSEGTIRKVLVTYGVIDTALTRRIRELRASGMPNKDIAELLEISSSCLNSNSPYEKCTYLIPSKTINAVRIRESRRKNDKTSGLKPAD